MFGVVIGALAGGVAGGISGYMGAKKQANAYKKVAAAQRDLAKAQRQYAQDVRDATDKYSGDSAYSAMLNAGNSEGLNQNQLTLENAASQGPNEGPKMSNVADLSNSSSFLSGYESGASNKATDLNARFDADTALSYNNVKNAQSNLNAAQGQVGIAQQQANVMNQAISGGLDTAQGLLKMKNNLKGAS